MARAPLGDEEAQHLPVRLAVGRKPLAGRRIVAQKRVDFIRVGSVPDAKPILNPLDLTVVGARGERNRVHVVEDDLMPLIQSGQAVVVGAEAGLNHLLELGRRGVGPSLGRVAELFDLGSQGASARLRAVEAGVVQDEVDRRLGQTVPLDGRVVIGVTFIQKAAVFEIEKAADHDRRDGFEVVVDPLGEASDVDRTPLPVEDGQTGLRLLREDRIEPPVHQLQHLIGHPRLAGDPVIARGQAVRELRKERVAPARVERPAGRETDAVTRSRRGREGEAGREAVEDPRLHDRGRAFQHRHGREQNGDRHHDQPGPEGGPVTPNRHRAIAEACEHPVLYPFHVFLVRAEVPHP